MIKKILISLSIGCFPLALMASELPMHKRQASDEELNGISKRARTKELSLENLMTLIDKQDALLKKVVHQSSSLGKKVATLEESIRLLEAKNLSLLTAQRPTGLASKRKEPSTDKEPEVTRSVPSSPLPAAIFLQAKNGNFGQVAALLNAQSSSTPSASAVPQQTHAAPKPKATDLPVVKLAAAKPADIQGSMVAANGVSQNGLYKYRFTWKNHAQSIVSLAVNNKGTFALSGGLDTLLNCWQAGENKNIKMARCSAGAPLFVKFYADDTQALIGTNQGHIEVHDMASKDTLKNRLVTGITPVALLTVSPNNDRVAQVSMRDQKYILTVFKIGKEIERKDVEYEAAVHALSFSPDGTTLLAAVGNTCQVYQCDSNLLPHALMAHEVPMKALCFMQDSVCASGSQDGTVIVWDLKKSMPLHTFKGIHKEITALAYDAKNDLLIAGGAEGTVSICKQGICIDTFVTMDRAPVTALCVNPVTDDIMVGLKQKYGCQVWQRNQASSNGVSQVAAPTPAPTGMSPVFSYAFAADVLAGGLNNGAIKVLNVDKSFAALLEGHKGAVSYVAFNPVVANQLISAGVDGTIRIWDLGSKSCIITLEGHKAPVTSLHILNKGQLVSTSEDKTVKLWDLRSGSLMQSIECKQPLSLATLMPFDNLSLVLVVSGTRLAVLDREKGALMNDGFEGSDAQITALIPLICPDDKVAEKKARLQKVSKYFHERCVIIGSKTGSIIVWDLQSGQPLVMCEGHTAAIKALWLDPETNNLISSAEDGTLKLWDLADADGRCLATYKIANSYGTALFYNQRTGKLLVCLHNGAIEVVAQDLKQV